MGFLSDIKRLLWVKKAVAESAAEKAVEKGREFGEDLADKASATWRQGKEKAEDFAEKITSRPKEEYSKPVDNAANDWVPKTESTAHKVGDKLGEAAEKIGD